MAQAKRTRPTRKSSAGTSPSANGLMMLVAGIAIGSLGTILWQGTNSSDSEVGAGIRNMMEQSRIQTESQTGETDAVPVDAPVKQETSYDFFTVLPEIEVVVPEIEPEPVKKNKSNAEKDEGTETAKVEDKSPTPDDGSAFMLQAGSYQKPADADKLKAQLGFIGLSSSIQKVTIQGRGDFYRVRLGPYLSHDQMAKVDQTLSENGIKALRLKISRGG